MEKIIEKDEEAEVAKPIGKPNPKTGKTEESDDDKEELSNKVVTFNQRTTKTKKTILQCYSVK